MTQHRDYYVYALLREDNQTPFYIGMGRGNRVLQHERNVHKKRSRKNSIILKVLASGLPEVPKIKLLSDLIKSEAIDVEFALINLIGRYPDGPLANISSGREGILGLTAECLEARRIAVAEAQRRPEVRALHSLRSKGRKCPKSPEVREKLRLACTGFKHTPDAIEKIRLASIGRKLSPERIGALRQFRLGKPMPPHVKAALIAANKGRKKSSAEIEKRRKAMLGRKFPPEVIERMKKAQSNRSPETRARISEAAKRGWIKRKARLQNQ